MKMMKSNIAKMDNIITFLPGSLRDSTVLTITGTGFHTTASNNTIMIGGVTCNVTTATDTEIQCDIGAGPAGSHDVIVNVDGKGTANGGFQFTYLFQADSISPSSGSIAGMFRHTFN